MDWDFWDVEPLDPQDNESNQRFLLGRESRYEISAECACVCHALMIISDKLTEIKERMYS